MPTNIHLILTKSVAMFKLYLQFVVVIIIVLSSRLQGTLLKWRYELLEINLNTTTPEHGQGHLEVARIDRRRFGVTGYYDLKSSLPDNECLVNIQIYRSPSGTGEYLKVPFEYKDQTCIHAMKTIYREAIMNQVQNCSNLPMLNPTWDGPIETKMYTMHKCSFSTDQLPSYIHDGYYKINVQFTGKLNVFVHAFIKVEQNTM